MSRNDKTTNCSIQVWNSLLDSLKVLVLLAYQFFPTLLRVNIIMENLQKIRLYVITLTTVAVIHSAVSQQLQRHLSGGTSVYSQPHVQLPQVQECGVQDKEQLPDFHAAAPWAAALFYVEGDFFQNEIKPQYLSTAVFVSKNLAITSGSKILAQQHTGLSTKLQLYYGHRASGKQTLIRIRKVEKLSPVRQQLALKVDTSTTTRVVQSQSSEQNNGKSAVEKDLYLLHLESVFDITSFSRPLCLNENIFQYKSQYFREVGSTNKLHISGYASKNDTNRQHVVYFSGDREWRVQSWNADDINVIMKEQQVTYDFLPKHFNSGSALTVKLNNQFFLVGILARSSGSQTLFRSLEKYIEMIQLKEMEYSTPKPTPLIDQQPSLQYGNNNNDNIGQYSSNQQYSSGSNSYQKSAVDAQLAHLEKSEFEEKLQNNPSFSSQQGSYNSNNGGNIGTNSNWGMRPTPRPDNSPGGVSTRPSILTHRPELQYTPQAQQVHNYDHNPPVPIQSFPSDGENGRRQQESMLYQNQRQPVRQTEPQFVYPVSHSTTTTVRSHLPSQSHYPPYLQQDGQRPSLIQQPDQYQMQQQQQQYYHQQQQHFTKCSHDYLEGVEIECISRQKGVSSADCIKSAPVNTTIRLSCKPHYVPLDGDKIIEKTCDGSGNWLPRKVFACKLDCGSVGNSVPYIVHGSKTAPEKWPWHAALFKRLNETSYTYICGATLITKSILVTAAHCVHSSVDGKTNRSLYKVVVGAISTDLLFNRKDPQAQEFNIKVIRVNEHYNPRNFEADIALIQLDKPVLLSDYVRPVCFPFPSDENKQVSGYQLSEGNSGIVVGFGTNENWSISSILRMATLPVVSVKNCTYVLERQPSSTQYCAGYTNGTSVCEGDSGGAQIFSDQYSKRYFIQGVISHGNRKDSTLGHSRCDHEKYTVFTKVSSFAEWVKKVVFDLEFDYNRRRRK